MLAVLRLFLRSFDAESSYIRRRRIRMFLGKLCPTFLSNDSPKLPCIQIDEAITALRADGDRLMAGPSLSGSYDFMRLKGFHPKSFSNIAKHTPAGFTVTCERAT